jgi:hypothetical protein
MINVICTPSLYCQTKRKYPEKNQIQIIQKDQNQDPNEKPQNPNPKEELKSRSRKKPKIQLPSEEPNYESKPKRKP